MLTFAECSEKEKGVVLQHMSGFSLTNYYYLIDTHGDSVLILIRVQNACSFLGEEFCVMNELLGGRMSRRRQIWMLPDLKEHLK